MKNFILKVENKDPVAAVAGFMKGLLTQGVVEALFVQQIARGGATVHALVKNPEALADSNPLAPISLQNAARLVADFSNRELDQKVGVVLRSCEVRALIELTKLKQANLDNLVIIGIDCLGTFNPSDYSQLVKSGKLNPSEWAISAVAGDTVIDGVNVRPACQICDHITAEHGTIHIGWVGMDAANELLIEVDDQYAAQINSIGLTEVGEKSERNAVIKKLLDDRSAAKDKALAEYNERFSSMDNLMTELATCLKCGNCRQACPICFCRECVFLSPTFNHDASKYLTWATRKGKIEMPTDTVLFHLTRANHMGSSCVNCGQCEAACPSNIPVSAMFQVMSKKVQDLFEYVPGRDIDEPLPLTTYKEVELEPR
ncbi:Coenzyme F420 hydrogenase/dehydrogenase, beta subunit C-terminal domain [Peptococcaceae bacterium 1198_IL3148]